VAGDDNIKRLSPEQVELLVGLFAFESLRAGDQEYVVAQYGDDVFAVWGNWTRAEGGDGYWETCPHCWGKLLPGFGRRTHCQKGG
jgi:hypothetical protein